MKDSIKCRHCGKRYDGAWCKACERLHNAAQDLLAASEEMMRTVSGYRGREQCAAYDAMVAAIAKAKGQ